MVDKEVKAETIAEMIADQILVFLESVVFMTILI